MDYPCAKFSNFNFSRFGFRITDADDLLTHTTTVVVPPAKLSTYAHSIFAISGARIWNSLPFYLKDSELSIFKRYLKIYFFACY